MQTQLIIVMREDGAIDVSGPLENKILCYGMIEIARQAIEKYVPSPIIQPVNGALNGNNPLAKA